MQYYPYRDVKLVEFQNFIQASLPPMNLGSGADSVHSCMVYGSLRLGVQQVSGKLREEFTTGFVDLR